MSAAWLWVRSDLRSRWRSWVVLGLLAGATFGLATAGLAGARRTSNALPRFVAAAHLPSAAILANDPAFDAAQRAAVARLPEVQTSYPFMVALVLTASPGGFETALLPTAPQTTAPMIGVLVKGKSPDPAKADEVVVDQNAEHQFGLHIGSVMTLTQSISAAEAKSAPPGFVPQGIDLNFRARLRVVGISKAVSSDASIAPSYGFYVKYRTRLAGLINEFIALKHGEADVNRLRTDVQRITGHPVNIEVAGDIFGTRKAKRVMALERNGLLLFALVALVFGWALVGQALVRSVSAGAADMGTWRAIGADRRIIIPALVAPTVVTGITAAASAIVAAIALSARFPIGLARQYDLDPGTHADWPVLALGAVAVLVAVLVTAWLAAWWRATRNRLATHAPSGAASWAARAGLPPAFVVGSRLAVEPGHGRRAVPVRSALVGAIAGVLGVVACFTFRAGINDTIATPERSGVVWDYTVASGAGRLPQPIVDAIARDRNVASVLDATWARAVQIDGVTTPTFGTTAVKGNVSLVVLEGHAPERSDEIAFAPATMSQLKTHVGAIVRIGTGTVTARVVGKVLLPATSHTDYDQSAWMTGPGLRAALPSTANEGADAVEDYLLIRWAPHAPVAAEVRKLNVLGGGSDVFFAFPPTLPASVVDLGRLRSLPLSLGIFFGLLACATVAHALVTTVRRRKHDFAVMRTLGLTRRQSRVAIAWQATLISLAGLVVGIPVGITTGRFVWRWLADNFPVAYVPPLAVVAVVLVAPAAVALANMLAAGPAYAATRIQPAQALRSE